MCEHRRCDVVGGLGEFVTHGLYILRVSLEPLTEYLDVLFNLRVVLLEPL